MLSTALLAVALAAAPPAASLTLPGPSLALPSLALPAPIRPLRYGEDDWEEGEQGDDEGEHRPHVLLSGWGGEALAGGGSGRSSSFWAAEGDWAFDSLDVGLQYASYRSLADATRPWTPVLLTRVTERFRTRHGIEAAFSLGFGAGKPSGWVGWYQVAIGVRVPLGPLFLGGEIAFEQYDIIRLGGGLGVAF